MQPFSYVYHKWHFKKVISIDKIHRKIQLLISFKQSSITVSSLECQPSFVFDKSANLNSSGYQVVNFAKALNEFMDPTWKQTAHNLFAFVAFRVTHFEKVKQAMSISALMTDYAESSNTPLSSF